MKEKKRDKPYSSATSVLVSSSRRTLVLIGAFGSPRSQLQFPSTTSLVGPTLVFSRIFGFWFSARADSGFLVVSGSRFFGSSSRFVRFSGWFGSSASLVRCCCCCLFGWYLRFSSSLLWFVFVQQPSGSAISLVAPTLVPFVLGSRQSSMVLTHLWLTTLWSSFFSLFVTGSLVCDFIIVVWLAPLVLDFSLPRRLTTLVRDSRVASSLVLDAFVLGSSRSSFVVQVGLCGLSSSSFWFSLVCLRLQIDLLRFAPL
ncbi:hypothetical protein U1Q18_006356 [Sarracenia purpurea var. burkii]